MGKRIILYSSIFFLFGCECSKEEVVEPLSSQDKEWFSFVANMPDYVSVVSDSGLTDRFILTKKYDPHFRINNTTPEGKCQEDHYGEMIRYNYYPGIYQVSFAMTITNAFERTEILFSESSYGANYSSLYFTFYPDDPSKVFNFYTYPGEYNTQTFLEYVGDTLINGKSFNDIYRLKLDTAGMSSPFQVSQLILSKKSGIVSYHFKNGIRWYIQF